MSVAAAPRTARRTQPHQDGARRSGSSFSGLVILIVALAIRWAEDVAAPFVNEGEAEMADTVRFESLDGGSYRIVTSVLARPSIHTTVCEIKGGDGEVDQERGADGIDGGHERFGATRVVELSIADGRAEVTCGNSRPTSGEGLGRFQIVDGDGPVALGGRVDHARRRRRLPHRGPALVRGGAAAEPRDRLMSRSPRAGRPWPSRSPPGTCSPRRLPAATRRWSVPASRCRRRGPPTPGTTPGVR